MLTFTHPQIKSSYDCRRNIKLKLNIQIYTTCNHRWKNFSDYVLCDEKTSFGSNLNANFHIQIFSHVFKGNNPFAMNKTKSYRNSCWTSTNFFSLVKSFAHKKNCNCTWGYFGTFFGWLHGLKALTSIHCLWHWNVVYSDNFFNKGSQKLEMFKFNMSFKFS